MTELTTSGQMRSAALTCAEWTPKDELLEVLQMVGLVDGGRPRPELRRLKTVPLGGVTMTDSELRGAFYTYLDAGVEPDVAAAFFGIGEQRKSEFLHGWRIAKSKGGRS